MRYVQNERLYGFEEPDFNTTELRLQRLESIRAIEECIFHYTKCADLADAAGMAACFSENGKLRWTATGAPIACGRQNMLHHFEEIAGRSLTQEHFCTNFQILFNSPKEAVGECNMFSWQHWPDPDKSRTLCLGRYEFQAVLEESQWRLSSLCLTLNAKLEGDAIAGGRVGEHFNRPWPPSAIGEEL